MPTSSWNPNPAQQQAVDHGHGPLRIQAGAGSGKTTTLVQRISALVERGLCRPEQILMLTFTTKAVEDIRRKVGDQTRVETYHAFALSLVREFADRLGLPPDPALLTEGPLKLLVRQHIDRMGFETFDLTRPDAAVARFLEFASWYRHEGAYLRPREELLAALTPEDDAEQIEDLMGAYDAYRALLREKGAVDYDDLIALAVELLTAHADVRDEVAGRHPFLLVDEYQDTDFLQGRLIRLLAGDAANVTIVGDPDQTIYSFRGAAMTNIMEFHKEGPAPADVAMVTNYRSTPEIVAAANAVIANNVRRKDDFLVADRPPGVRPVLATAPDWESEAAWVAAEILRLGIPYADIAILVRKNTHKLPLYAALTEAGIPVEVVGGLDLFDDPETVRCIGYIRALANPDDDGAMTVALSMPRYGLTDREIAALARSRSGKEPLIHTAAGSSDPRVALFLGEFWPLYARQFSEGPVAAVRRAIALHASSLSPQARANAEQLILLAEGLFARPSLFVASTTGLPLFTAYLGALRDVGERMEAVQIDSERQAVKLMTVHSAKGLEWPVVFLPRLTERDFAPAGGDWKIGFPLAWHHDEAFRANPAEMMAEEERRLFYVAVTRAKDRLYLSFAPRLYRNKPTAPSPFLAELAACCDPVEIPEAAAKTDVAIDGVLDALVSDAPAAPHQAPVPADETEIPTMLSFSHLHTYQLCPYRFYLQYVLRAPGRPNRSADEGVRVHAAIEKHGGSGALELYEPDVDPYEGEAHSGLQDPLKAYIDSEYATTPALASEAEFHLRLGEAVLRGFIDRVHRRPADGVVEVVDFKTYNRLMSPDEVKAGLQLPLYILAARQALGLPGVSDGALFFLKHGEVVRVRYTEAELADRLAEASRLVAAIRSQSFDPAPGPVCKHCPYQATCPF